jgi:hypothetical protein
MMIPMVCDPSTGRTRSVEASKENQDLLDNRMELNRAMRESTMIADCRAESTRARHSQSGENYPPTRKGK